MRNNANSFVGHRIMLNLEYCIIVRFLLDISSLALSWPLYEKECPLQKKTKTKTKTKNQQIRKSVVHNKNS